jgi:predicted GNAT family acetyltransferase
MDEVQISSLGTAEKGEYQIHLPEVSGVAKLSWSGDDKHRTVNSTFVPASMRGRGIAALLVDRLIADARSEGFRIRPRCSYVEWAFAQHPEWSDLLVD